MGVWLARFIDRRHQILLIAAVGVGISTGAGVAAFDALTAHAALGTLLDAPIGVQAAFPLVGLVLAWMSLRYVAGGADATTSDAYIANYHERNKLLDQRPVIGRILASIATLGSGGAMGFEGPAIYMGAAIGSGVQGRIARFLRSDDAKALLVAGAAGGVAAIFKAPATGVLYALEVPYHEDIARSGIVSSLVAAAASYVTFVLIMGTHAIVPLTTTGTGFGAFELAGAAVVGVLAGFGARGFTRLIDVAKRTSKRVRTVTRIAVFGALSAVLVLGSQTLFAAPLSLGPGYQIFGWLTDPSRGMLLVLALFVVRALATTATVAGGGAGGMFIPLVVQGAVLGRLVGGAFLAWGPHTSAPATSTLSLFTVLGIAAFLGAGYRTPLAGVMFVAESTGRAVFVVPALVAAAISQLCMGDHSISPFQRTRRWGHLEGRFALPLARALMTDVLTLPRDATVAEFVSQHVVQNRQRAAVVLDEGAYVGICVLRDAAAVPREEWEARCVDEIMRTDLPAASLTWKLGDVLRILEGDESDRLAVIGEEGTFLGEVRREEIVRLDELLDDAGA